MESQFTAKLDLQLFWDVKRAERYAGQQRIDFESEPKVARLLCLNWGATKYGTHDRERRDRFSSLLFSSRFVGTPRSHVNCDA